MMIENEVGDDEANDCAQIMMIISDSLLNVEGLKPETRTWLERIVDTGKVEG